MPVSAPIAYVSLKRLADVEFGRIVAGHPCYERYRKYLKRTVEEPFALFLPVLATAWIAAFAGFGALCRLATSGP